MQPRRQLSWHCDEMCQNHHSHTYAYSMGSVHIGWRRQEDGKELFRVLSVVYVPVINRNDAEVAKVDPRPI